MSDTPKKATFEIGEEVHKALKIMSVQRGIPMSELVQEALKDFLKKEGVLT